MLYAATRGGRNGLDRWTALVVSFAVVVALGCGRKKPPLELGQLALAISASAEVTGVHFDIRGNGFVRTGDIDVSGAHATPSLLLGGIPAGAGYAVVLTARSVDGRTTCEGNATATVAANSVTGVAVVLKCRTVSDLGGVIVNGSFNRCPRLVSLAASPAEMALGDQEAIDVAAQAEDAENSPLAYRWTASSGGFADPAAVATVFRCAAPGPVDVTLTVSDGMCQETVTATLRCLPFCTTKANGTRCNDENACTRSDTCQGGACVGDNPVVCEPLDPCHVAGVCDIADGSCSQPEAPDGTTCQLPQATAACTAGACAITSCAAGVDDCNHAAPDGCETPLDTNANCGACSRACGAGTSCEASRCLNPPPADVAALAAAWKVTVSWSVSPGALQYEVHRALAAAGPFDKIGATTGTRFVDLAVASGVTYHYRVTVVNAEGPSRPSSSASATPPAKQLCVNSNSLHSVFAFQADAGGGAAQVRVLGGNGTTGRLTFPTSVTSSLLSDELFVMKRGGTIDVFPVTASGDPPPARSLTGATPAGVMFALDVDDAAGNIYAADFSPAGRLLAVNSTTGARTRLISGDNARLGNPAGLVVDPAHGEVLIATGGAAEFSRVLTYDLGGSDGNIAPKRTLGATAGTAVGRWALALDRRRDEILTTCNCDNKITVFDRGGTGDPLPRRTLLLPPAVIGIYALLMDEGADTVWAVARTSSSNLLMQLPRSGNGAVSPLGTPATISTVGFLARCN